MRHSKSSKLDLGSRIKRTHLETLVQDNLLPLETDVLGPLDEAGQVLLGGQVTSDAESASALLEQRVLSSLLGLLGAVGGGCWP
jgi:hypothetical protein